MGRLGGANGIMNRRPTIALIDTGVASLPEFEGHVVAHYEVTNQGEIVRREKGEDLLAHGTACADIIRRISPNAAIVDLRVMDKDHSNSAQKLEVALGFALAQDWEIINISVGQKNWHEPIAHLLNESASDHCRVLAAVDNFGEAVGFPACHPAVTAVDMDYLPESKMWRQSKSREVDILAHGIYVPALTPSGKTRHFTGSSFAAPHFAAILANQLAERI